MAGQVAPDGAPAAPQDPIADMRDCVRESNADGLDDALQRAGNKANLKLLDSLIEDSTDDACTAVLERARKRKADQLRRVNVLLIVAWLAVMVCVAWQVLLHLQNPDLPAMPTTCVHTCDSPWSRAKMARTTSRNTPGDVSCTRHT